MKTKYTPAHEILDAPNAHALDIERRVIAFPDLVEALRAALAEIDAFQKYWTSPKMGLKRGKCAAQELAEDALRKAGVE